MTIRFEEKFNHALPAIESKREEFRLYGYPTVTNEEIWKFCIRRKWRKKNIEEMPIHEIVNSILRLTSAEFMTFTQIEEQRDANWFSDLNSDELQLLLSPKTLDFKG
ncbi:post-transcriptional regulator [Sporosarcina highlanderae]|uniref:Post-transcriptional regulator n=1 Tax=Sporosarcina highlanderae TaxID=3035916 RepID=A0ABT8JPX7_9BACL|nr:post-transcriptional regulator [Sporosarcina highlanderae]MDN4607114.1 post-transcriptional regulator [Sporosarcina highlanderae]